nr:glycosyltransferase family 2 protein [uncultured Desulfobacter sp.]
MYKKKSIAVVVPAHNEEKQIGMVIETMPEFVDHIVIIDDESPDRTSEVTKEYQTKYPKVVLIEHEVNQGVGGAIASGYKWARDNDIDVAVVMAGDGQMNPDDLPNIIEPIINGEVDYTKGNRLFTGEAFKKIPKVRYFGNSALSLLTKIASGYWHVADSQTGYTAVNKKVLKTIDWDRMYKRYGQPNDLLVRLNLYNFRVRDVPVEPVYNNGEQSGINIKKAIFSIGWLIVKLFFWRIKEKYIIRDFHPLVFFYLLGFFMGCINIFFFFRLFYRWSVEGAVPEITFLIWMFSFSIGLISVFFAMWFDMEYNKHLK